MTVNIKKIVATSRKFISVFFLLSRKSNQSQVGLDYFQHISSLSLLKGEEFFEAKRLIEEMRY